MAVQRGSESLPPTQKASPVAWSAVDGGHLRLFVALAGGRGEVC
jgi:hypothetical protein